MARGEGSPALQFLSRARGSPTPWAWATIPLTGPRPMRRSNLLGPEKEAPGGGSGRTSLRGLPFLSTHRPAHAPTGAERARRQPTHDPYRPRGARRKPQSIRAFARARAIACASGTDTAANWGRGLGPAGCAKRQVWPRQGLVRWREGGCLACVTGHPSRRGMSPLRLARCLELLCWLCYFFCFSCV